MLRFQAISRMLPGSPAQFGAARAAGIYGFNWGARAGRLTWRVFASRREVRSLVTLLKPHQAQQDGCEQQGGGCVGCLAQDPGQALVVMESWPLDERMIGKQVSGVARIVTHSRGF